MNEDYLKTLYRSSDLSEIWKSGQNEKLIKHPKIGWISPNEYRQKFNNKPCPFCGKKMVHGKLLHSTQSKKEAIARGYQYKKRNGDNYINRTENFYFHPNYVTLDHKINKARCPELLFEFSNLNIICWKCNQEKGDNNNFEAEYTFDCVRDLAKEALKRFKPL
ncbi:MAG: HNH endonuclease [Kamptonema sp. SIO1D9]|nr:HNH endonuclease [Kamptonema sp. SIO1D9]